MTYYKRSRGLVPGSPPPVANGVKVVNICQEDRKENRKYPCTK